LPLRNLLSIGSDLVEHAARNGGRGRCYCRPEAVVAEFSGLTNRDVEPLVDALAKCQPNDGVRCTVIVSEIPEPAVPHHVPIQPGEYLRTKLTKTFLHTLPPGALLLSSARDAEGQPLFCALVRESHDRGELWKAAKSMGVANRTVDVLWDMDDVGELIAPPAVETPESGEECWAMTE
jgi:hypothetical protein